MRLLLTLWGVSKMHSRQYLLVSIACISFAAILLMWLIEPTLEKAVKALK